MTSSAPLFDTHCHLDDPRFAEDFDAVLARAREAGLWRAVTIGCAREVATVESALAVARAHADWVSTTIGVHPHDAAALFGPEADALWGELERIATDPQVVAVGEMGLDYYYDNSPREQQQEAFRRQIALARQVSKPIVVHTRDAREDTLRILREEKASEVGGIIHCFSEDAPFAAAALDLGFVSSFSGIVTFKRAKAVQEAARKQPADAILVETDAPYLAPVPKRGKRNEPAFVAHTAAVVAELRGEDEDALRRRTSENAARLFGLPLP
ncbi:MAG TPA: TatD family hydrolase [Polyangiaceae bacterium LLY-WYZ-15_(1-7)]|nr:hydrolase TatD [Myxococcales bacterium]MAT24979.1 hydrolase TatD [Sandaracinus sp.]HJL01332.1 TatD family hydrolase [Polyangiaceae bacterium LLY-WYZ-15_(1-7)]HJL13481.1 TatD family hydrolase [Polyangiaceae bacterium LLY-WYZ-15_(1-7)]HJL24243.1 TatD family hydrolase [Polyangiaceae bacterium LLY-WYZ-15_(1-7)]